MTNGLLKVLDPLSYCTKHWFTTGHRQRHTSLDAGACLCCILQPVVGDIYQSMHSCQKLATNESSCTFHPPKHKMWSAQLHVDQRAQAPHGAGTSASNPTMVHSTTNAHNSTTLVWLVVFGQSQKCLQQSHRCATDLGTSVHIGIVHVGTLRCLPPSLTITLGNSEWNVVIFRHSTSCTTTNLGNRQSMQLMRWRLQRQLTSTQGTCCNHNAWH